MKLKVGELYKFINLRACHRSSAFYCMCEIGAYTFLDWVEGKINETTPMLFIGYEKHSCEKDVLSTNIELALFLSGKTIIHFRTFKEEEIFKFKNHITANIYDELIKNKQVNIELLVKKISS